MLKLKSQQSQLQNAGDIAIKVGTAIVLIAFTHTSVFAATSAISKNEAILSRFSTCSAANKAGYKNLKTRVGFKPKSASRPFDADKDGIYE